MRYRVNGIRVNQPFQQIDNLQQVICAQLGLDIRDLIKFEVVKASIDARKKPYVKHVLTINIESQNEPKPGKGLEIRDIPEEKKVPNLNQGKKHVVVVGSGPSGLFASLALIEAGFNVSLLERGSAVEPRMVDIGQLRSKGVLKPESNVCFGEGGAGTYTDGKLYTRIKHGWVNWVLRRLVGFGAPSDILIDAHPHLGTDILKKILLAFRKHLLERGCNILFDTKVDSLLFSGHKVVGVRSQSAEISADAVILSTGHSARDLYEHLHESGIHLETKPFAVGVRVEHPQILINESQYGKPDRKPIWGAADYRLSHQWKGDNGTRGVYSFCMCPGGFIVPSPTEPEMMVVNGMSNANRSTAFANSGIVVQVFPEDLQRAGYHNQPLMGVHFQRDLEKAAFKACSTPYFSPATRISDFLSQKQGIDLAPTHFRPGAQIADMGEILPHWIIQPLRQGLEAFNQKIKGFTSNEANMFAVESRTSSPVRITRNASFSSVNFEGLYPAGEGAGYAGGIVSAAVDGLRVAEAIANL